MSWIRSKPEGAQGETATAVAAPNYNRDMKSPPVEPRQTQPATGNTTGNATGHTAGNATIGKSIQIEGTLTGNENLTIDGRVQGRIKLNGHSLTIGPNGKIDAGLRAKTIVVRGEVNGNIAADDKIQITASGSVQGDLKAPRIALDDGAQFAGSVDMGETKKG
jgi:cytoskeletal protein CcmA (bactofilin family)